MEGSDGWACQCSYGDERHALTRKCGVMSRPRSRLSHMFKQARISGGRRMAVLRGTYSVEWSCFVATAKFLMEALRLRPRTALSPQPSHRFATSPSRAAAAQISLNLITASTRRLLSQKALACGPNTACMECTRDKMRRGSNTAGEIKQ